MYRTASDRVRVTAGGRLLIEWQGSPDRLSLRPCWSVASQDCLFVGSYKTSFRITRLDLRPVSGEGRRLSLDEALADTERLTAERILWRQGRVRVSVDGEPALVAREANDLPASFRLLGVTLRGRKPVTPGDLAALSGLDGL